MKNIELDNIKELLKKGAKGLVGKLCKRIEILSKNNVISEENKKILLNILKPIFKELIYENYRESYTNIESYSKGLEDYKIEFKREKG